MLCLACGEASSTPMCVVCRSTLRAAPDALAPSGLLVRAGFSHVGSAVRLVHRLKYEGVTRSAGLLAAAMASLLPDGVLALVPIPRSVPRRLRYGVDPGRELALALRRATGLPVVDCLRAELWHRANAGRSRAGRSDPRFALLREPPPGSVIVDDVFTTGMTLSAAHRLIGPGVLSAVTATRALVGGNPEPAGSGGILPRDGRIDERR